MSIVKRFWEIFIFGIICIPFAVWKWVDIIVFVIRHVSAALGKAE